MKQLHRTFILVALVAFTSPFARADEVPHINKRGDDEKKFAEQLATAIVRAARTSIKEVTLDEFKKKTPKEGRSEWLLTAGFKGAATGKPYTANIVVLIDTSDKDNWEVLRIEYDDNSKNVVNFNRKNVEDMVKKLNRK
jgi:hypothetical protein